MKHNYLSRKVNYGNLKKRKTNFRKRNTNKRKTQIKKRKKTVKTIYRGAAAHPVQQNEEAKARKDYDTLVWKILRGTLKKNMTDHPSIVLKLITLLQKFITKLLQAINTSGSRDTFWKKFEDKYDNKLNFYLTGLIDHKKFTEINNTENNTDIAIKTTVETYCITIRQCLTTVDYILKTFEALDSHGIMGILIETFDNCIRHRDSESKNEFIKNPSNPKVMMVNDAYIPLGKNFCIQDYKQIFPGSKTKYKKEEEPCATFGSNEELLEPFSKDETEIIIKTLDERYKEKQALIGKTLTPEQMKSFEIIIENEFEFTPGVNIFTLDDQPDSVDLFAAGISGHTAEIGLMFKLFSNIEGNQQGFQNIIALVCLIWMADALHHSSREILLASCIHFKESEKMFEIIDNLYKVKNKEDKTGDTYRSTIEAAISELIENTNTNIDELTTNLECNQSVVKFLLNNEGVSEGVSEGVVIDSAVPVINSAYENILKLKSRLLDSTTELIKWPTSETCNNLKIIEFHKKHDTYYKKNGLVLRSTDQKEVT